MENELKQMSDDDLMNEYNELRNRIDGLTEGGYGKQDLYYLSEIERELTLREG